MPRAARARRASGGKNECVATWTPTSLSVIVSVRGATFSDATVALAAEALLLARRGPDPYLERVAFLLLRRLDFGDAVVARLAVATLEAQVAPDLVLKPSITRRLGHRQVL